METVYINGNSHLIMDNKDIPEVIEKYCGYDLARIVEKKMVDIDFQKLLAKEKAKTDEESYLFSLESAECCLRDILEMAEEVATHIEDSKRINKDMIWNKMHEIIKQIGNEI